MKRYWAKKLSGEIYNPIDEQLTGLLNKAAAEGWQVRAVKYVISQSEDSYNEEALVIFSKDNDPPSKAASVPVDAPKCPSTCPK